MDATVEKSTLAFVMSDKDMLQAVQEVPETSDDAVQAKAARSITPTEDMEVSVELEKGASAAEEEELQVTEVVVEEKGMDAESADLPDKSPAVQVETEELSRTAEAEETTDEITCNDNGLNEEKPLVQCEASPDSEESAVKCPDTAKMIPDVAKQVKMRSSTWRSFTATLKKRSIKWLNRNRYHMMYKRSVHARKMPKGSQVGYGNLTGGQKEIVDAESKFNKVQDDEDEEESNSNIENHAKRPRIDDDVEIVAVKSEDEDSSVCDRTNGKEDDNDEQKIAQDEVPSTDSPSIIDGEQCADHAEKLDPKKNQREKSPAMNYSVDDSITPTKKLCLELEMNFATHDKILTDYIESTPNESANDIQRHVEQLIVEIQTLNDMIRAKEMEWNNMIHLKKVKEEIVARLTRKRHVLEFANTTLAPDDVHRLSAEAKDLSEASITKITQALLLNRANLGANELQRSNSNSSESRNAQHALSAAFGANAAGESSRNRSSDCGLSASQASAFPSDLFNGHNTRLTQQMGRQGAIKDVKSIIADYRQRHPEIVPRRGRRMKSMLSENSCPKESGNSRPSSADSSHSNAANSNFAPSTGQQNTSQSGTTIGNLSFKDVLVQFAKLSQSDRQMISTTAEASSAANAVTNSLGGKAPPPYPEVTLYPVNSQSSAEQIVLSNTNNTHSNSLLHGILTKSTTRPNAPGFTSFSPTLARLLTAPERITTTQSAGGGQFQQQINPALNLSKSHSEITITPVVSQTNLQQSLMQQQQQQRFDNCNNSSAVQIRMKQENIFNIDDEADDSADRLVIDEGGDRNLMESGSAKDQQISMVGQEFHENEVPECQGCKKREAQFVCAGCGNQWYCSRECQVSAWDEHSEVCTG
ncbi:uncharacterized protein LOC132256366 [Phlebotomus argentipes]|uniref:uncharacterized protein LOC132256366 n=1 Tax=Phlebotomus argentipes TaxID=94469 RepID=UPI0028933AAC|nr:uncharacterized protein LOC132256366 [Phlebotomus argentipes]